MKGFKALPFIHPLATNIYLIEGPERGRFPHCNGYLLFGDRTVLIDAGIGAERIGEVDRRVRVDTLIISHSHPDHILAWHVLGDRQLCLPAQTPESVYDLASLGRRFVEGAEGARYWTWVVESRLGIRPLRRPEQRFDDGETLDFGSLRLRAIHAPGHLTDHYCFLETRSGTLFSIDIDFTGFGPWYGNPEGDIDRFRKSVKRLRGMPFTQICSAHKSPIAQADAEDAFDRYLGAFDRQKAAIEALCRQGMDLDTMVRVSPFYRNRMFDETLQHLFETQMIRKNLALLVEEKRIVETNGRYRLV
jgi:glyoxylase-like metal-dependent hydrolase (beta-lactamase superfamily II)